MKLYLLAFFSLFTFQSFADSQKFPTGDQVFQINDTMRVISVTYGGNCGAPEGNINIALNHCNGYEVCNYQFYASQFPEAAALKPECLKDLFVRYICGKDTMERQAYRYAEADQKTIYLTCAKETSARIFYKDPLSYEMRRYLPR